MMSIIIIRDICLTHLTTVDLERLGYEKECHYKGCHTMIIGRCQYFGSY